MIIYNSNGSPVNLKDNCIASGGEGEIHLHPSNKDQVIKLYHQPRSKDFELLLNKLKRLGLLFVKPIDIFYNKKGLVVGFSMDFVNFNDYFLLNNLFNKGFCVKNNIAQESKIKILEIIKDAVTELHKDNLIVVDLNQYNIFFSLKGEVLFVDVDSYSEKSNVRSDVILEDIRDFTTNKIDESSDIYAYNTLTFWILTYCHPFKWIAQGNTDTFEQKVRSGRSYLSKIPNIKIPALYNPLPSIIESQFLDIFRGRRFMIDFNNTPQQINVQSTQVITKSKSVDIKEIASNIVDINVCNNRIAIKQNNQWLLYSGFNVQALNLIKAVQCGDLYPSNDNYCYNSGDELYSSKDVCNIFFTKDMYKFYQNGELFILDYNNDSFYIYKVDNQINSKIDYSRQIIFAKSVIIRNSIIQNFGAKKVIGIVRNKNLSLITVPQTTKDAIVCNNYVCIESLEKGKIISCIYKINNTNIEKILYTNNLCFFAVKNDFLFIPSLGEIEVYKDGKLLERLDVSICTQDSKLYITNAGLVLLESGKLYLLNKK